MNWAQQWVDAAVQSLNGLMTEVAEFVPNLAGMFLILGVGYVLSRILQRIASVLLHRVGFDRAAQRVGLRTLLDQANISIDASRLVGKLVFWLFMLTFVISAADALGLSNVSQTVDSFVRYLPNVIAAVVIAVAGLFAAGFVRDLVRGSTARIGFEYGQGLAQLSFGVVVVLVATLAIGQLGIETDLIARVIEILLLGAGAALALALGLGTRDLTKHIVAGAYARDIFAPGARLAIGDDVGHLVEVGTVNAQIATDSGETIYIPNSHLIESVVRGGAPPPANPE